MIRLVLVGIGGVLVLLVAQAGLAFLTPPAPAPGFAGLLPVLFSNALTAAILLALARRMPAAPLRRALALWSVWGGVQTLSLVELFLFDIGATRIQTVGLMVHAVAVAAAAAAFMTWFAPQRNDVLTPPAAVGARPVWLALAPPLYALCYFTAGALVWPFIAAYYQARPMPALGPLLALQLVRGLGFGAIVLLIIRVCDGRRGERAVLAGLTLAVLGGAAPLVMPNPMMPEAIRLAHLFEMVPSLFLFGSILALALTRHSRQAIVLHQAR